MNGRGIPRYRKVKPLWQLNSIKKFKKILKNKRVHDLLLWKHLDKKKYGVSIKNIQPTAKNTKKTKKLKIFPWVQ